MSNDALKHNALANAMLDAQRYRKLREIGFAIYTGPGTPIRQIRGEEADETIDLLEMPIKIDQCRGEA